MFTFLYFAYQQNRIYCYLQEGNKRPPEIMIYPFIYFLFPKGKSGSPGFSFFLGKNL